ncbi:MULTISPECIES: hypothetical protein [unclassified Nocardia]|uniref:hypothetical protein n=1 Tax=unclassified Nocardia TaxID=2637762 RepID=UPI001CE3F911|nr:MULTISPECIES: hypothetical protein [unclassified Nocardia]
MDLTEPTGPTTAHDTRDDGEHVHRWDCVGIGNGFVEYVCRDRSCGAIVKPEQIIVDEWWIPAGLWSEVAVYDPLRAAELIAALHTEMTARRDHLAADTEPGNPALLIIGIDDLPTLKQQWQHLTAGGDRHTRDRLAALDPAGTVNTLIRHGLSTAIHMLLGAPAAAMPQRLYDNIGSDRPSAGQPADTECAPPSSRQVPVWRTPAAPTRALLAFPGHARDALRSAELIAFVENL